MFTLCSTGPHRWVKKFFDLSLPVFSGRCVQIFEMKGDNQIPDTVVKMRLLRYGCSNNLCVKPLGRVGEEKLSIEKKLKKIFLGAGGKKK